MTAIAILSTVSSKTCTKCITEKPITDFWAMASSKDGFAWHCKACAAKASANWRAANKEKLKASKAEHHAAKKEHYNAKSRAWRLANLEYSNSKNKAYRDAHAEEAKERAVQWRISNLERSRNGVREWRQANPDAVREINKAFLIANPGAKRAYESNRRKNATGKLSRNLVSKLFKLQNGKCPCCAQPLGDDYHLDHKMPLALGGSNTDDNMQLLRKICNLQKSAKHPIDFMQSRGFLL